VDDATLGLDSGGLGSPYDLSNLYGADPFYIDAFNYPVYSSGGTPTTTGLPNIDDVVNTVVNTGLNTLDNAIAQAINNGGSSGTVDPVPTQNQITSTILKPVSDALQVPAVLSSAPTLSALLSFLQQGQAKWMQFAQSYPSSRMTGAVNTLAPYWTNLTAAISAALAKLGVTVPATPTIPGTNIPMPGSTTTRPPSLLGGMSNTTLLLLGGLVFLAMRKR